MSDRRPCRCDRWRPGEAFDAARDCAPCFLFHTDLVIAARWSGALDAPPAVRPSPPPKVTLTLAKCVHEGRVLKECEFGDDLRHLRACSVHGQSTRVSAGWPVMTCGRCVRDGLGYEPGDAGG